MSSSRLYQSVSICCLFLFVLFLNTANALITTTGYTETASDFTWDFSWDGGVVPSILSPNDFYGSTPDYWLSGLLFMPFNQDSVYLPYGSVHMDGPHALDVDPGPLLVDDRVFDINLLSTASDDWQILSQVSGIHLHDPVDHQDVVSLYYKDGGNGSAIDFRLQGEHTSPSTSVPESPMGFLALLPAAAVVLLRKRSKCGLFTDFA